MGIVELINDRMRLVTVTDETFDGLFIGHSEERGAHSQAVCDWMLEAQTRQVVH